MAFCYFLSITAQPGEDGGLPADSALSDSALTALHELAGQTPGLKQLRVHTPADAHDPMLNDGQGPTLVLQALFDEIAPLERALSDGGELHGLLANETVRALKSASFTQQTMLVRPYPVPAARPELDQGEPHCTYLVGYEGPAQDTAAWLSHYLDGHPELMAKLPGIRRVEIYSRLDWCGTLPWPRADFMQRNQVVFDSTEALTNALANPLRVQMREHFQDLPPFAGEVTHFPMRTIVSRPSR